MRDSGVLFVGFLQNILQKPCFVTSSRFVITIYCFEDEEMIVAVKAIA